MLIHRYGTQPHVSTINVERYGMIFTPEHSRAARALLDWKQERLASEAGIGLSTVVDFEKQRRAVSADKIERMHRALEAVGIKFQNGGQPGVRLLSGENTKSIEHNDNG